MKAALLRGLLILAGWGLSAQAGHIMVEYEADMNEFGGFPPGQHVSGNYIFDEFATPSPPWQTNRYPVVHMEMTVGGVYFMASSGFIWIVNDEPYGVNIFQDDYSVGGQTSGIFAGNLEVISFGVWAETRLAGSNPSVTSIDLPLSLEDMDFPTYNADIVFRNLSNNGLYRVDGPDAILVFSRVNTLPGLCVTVLPESIDAGGNSVPGAPTAVVQFSEVTHGGMTVAVLSDDGPPPPDGYRFGDPELFLALSTSATYSGAVDICVDPGFLAFYGPPEALMLVRYTDAGWIDITDEGSPELGTLCGSTDSLGLLAVVEPADPVALLDELIGMVLDLSTDKGTRKSLLVKLEQVRGILTDSRPANDVKAVTFLQKGVIRKLEKLTGKKLPAEETQPLIDLAEEIMQLLAG